jgi:non-ribosomal peptide synthetase component E (peptide arylation enzyme)
VLYAAIVGIPDPRLGERNCLCLVPRPGETPTLKSLVAFLGNSVATYDASVRQTIEPDEQGAVDPTQMQPTAWRALPQDVELMPQY